MEKMQFQANTALRSYALALLFFAAAFALGLLIDYVVPDRLAVHHVLPGRAGGRLL